MKANPLPDARGKRTRRRPAKQSSVKLSGEIELLRMRVAAAESLLKEAREQARQAKRRRKLAKLLAKRARKDAKQAKLNLADAKASLARAEAALRTNRRRTVKRRVTRTKPAAGRLPSHVTKPSAEATATAGAADSSRLPTSTAPAISAGPRKIPIAFNPRTEQSKPAAPGVRMRFKSARPESPQPNL